MKRSTILLITVNLRKPPILWPWNRQASVQCSSGPQNRQHFQTVAAAEKNSLQPLPGGVAIVDQQIGRLLANNDDQVAVMLTADHGRAFWRAW
ncbi:MAG: hypothetical protein H6662_02870 [Ardenticatenaceae bacterium]|nr:hypothetical protein [Ardenticatenaceae bacterium]